MTEEEITLEETRQFIHIKDSYIPTHIIGEGSFSTVYKAIDIINSSKTNIVHVALKNITRTTAPCRVFDELRILKLLAGKFNTVPLLNAKRFEDQIIAVFPYFMHTDFREFMNLCTLEDISHYMRSLITSLKWVHEHKIIHRDIKPSNFLYDMISRRGMLIDFGLAQQYVEPVNTKHDNKVNDWVIETNIVKNTLAPGYYLNDSRKPMKANRAGTRGFRAPEVLFKVAHQTEKIDMWSVGVIFLMLLTRQYPFFVSMDDVDALVEIANIFGHVKMMKAARFYNRIWKSNIVDVSNPGISLEEVVCGLNPDIKDAYDAFSLLEMLMELKDVRRLSAEVALTHPFLRNWTD